MIFKEYHDQTRRLNELRATLSEILAEKEAIFQMTQPVAERQARLSMDQYVITLQKSEVDVRAEEAKRLIEDREKVVDSVREELLRSPEMIDKVYVRRYIKQWKVMRIALDLGYSEGHIYYLLREIRRILCK